MSKRVPAKFKCMYCGAITQKICRHCEITFYCSEEHEQLDWEVHRGECLDTVNRLIKEQRESSRVPSLKELARMRQEFRKNVFQNYGEGNLEIALIYAKQLEHVTREIYKASQIDLEYSEVCADILLGMRVLLKRGDRESLELSLDEFMAGHGAMLVNMSNMPKEDGDFDPNQFEHFRRKTEIVATVANLYYAVGNLRKCEEVMVEYCRMFEQTFGPRSLEFSNGVFLLGVFYYEHSYYQKSLACFYNCLEVRLECFDNSEESNCIADCYYNLAILSKAGGDPIKAIEYLKRVIALRTKLFLGLSVQVADAQEAYGNVLIEEEEFESGLTALMECYTTRKKMLSKEDHEDIQRV
jgi:tetratricopeptide (TPR) repeat protein